MSSITRSGIGGQPPDEPNTGESSFNGGRITSIEQRVDRLYKEHYGEGDYEGTREQLRLMRHAIDQHFREYSQDQEMMRRERAEDREETAKMFRRLERHLTPDYGNENGESPRYKPTASRSQAGLWLLLALIATASIVWMALSQMLRG